MPSLVIELQNRARDPNVSVSTLLRDSLTIASKLNLSEFEMWVENELNGYPSKEGLPSYRQIHCEYQAFNPYRRCMIPIIWRGQMPEELHTAWISQKIAELESSAQSNESEKGLLTMTMSDSFKGSLMTQTNGLEPYIVVSLASIKGILDAVRTAILKWTLKLEKRGILGENMTFTPDEKTKAAQNIYNISNSNGVFFGPVQADALQVGHFNSILEDLKRLGIPQAERNALENITDELKETKEPEKRRAIMDKGLSWVLKHADKLGDLARVINKWFAPES